MVPSLKGSNISAPGFSEAIRSTAENREAKPGVKVTPITENPRHPILKSCNPLSMGWGKNVYQGSPVSPFERVFHRFGVAACFLSMVDPPRGYILPSLRDSISPNSNAGGAEGSDESKISWKILKLISVIINETVV